ncbi:MAG: exodeoxyribonuclease VII large subunit [Magnetococcales bacterium]|nr:exodeoxyribonuclease VII large subunit [Magnetococcales bacterium]
MMNNAPIQNGWLSVSELNEKIRDLLEEGLSFIRVEAEISELRAPPSGHLYCTLIDGESRIRAVIWRTTRIRLSTEPRSGDRVQISGRIAVYAPRGEYQVIIEGLKPVGSGDERQRFILLHARLAAEGIFSPEKKKLLPLLPTIIGIVTSKTGAALQDILRVLDDRFSNLHIILSPTLVQGDSAPEEIAWALRRLAEDGRAEVIICGRGGGSAEDLSAFNSETVVRAIANSPIPVISAVGHEVDQTLADLAADRRAATPSAAAEQVIPEKIVLMAQLKSLHRQLIQAAQQQMERHVGRLNLLRKQLIHPTQRINQARLRSDELTERLFAAAQSGNQPLRKKLADLTARLENWPKSRYFGLYNSQLNQFRQQLSKCAPLMISNRKTQLAAQIQQLSAVSPQAVLNRGYAIVLDNQGRIVRDASEMRCGQIIQAQLANGRLTAKITQRS